MAQGPLFTNTGWPNGCRSQINRLTDRSGGNFMPDKGLVEIKIRWSTRAAWFFVALGAIVAAVAIRQLVSEGKFDFDQLSKIGSYSQGTVASAWALAGILFIYATFLAQTKH